MSAAKFAPAPWHVIANDWQHTTVYDAKQMPVCRFDLVDWDVNEDNQYELKRAQSEVARLIAAAPELLAELKALLPGAIAMGWNTTKADAAIAKATGAAE